MDLGQLREKAKVIKEALGLDTYPVGVKFIFDEPSEVSVSATRLLGYRYCQTVMRARHGEHVTLDKEGITCAAGTAVFGFKPLPEALKNGKGLVGFGITKEESTGVEMFRGMTTLKPGELKKLYLFPLETAVVEPDIVVIEDETEKLMWVSLAYLNAKGGKRVESSTAILQAVCVDATLIPYKEQRMNLSYGCYGCRDANDIKTGETAVGFPFKDFEKVSEYIEYLAIKAVGNSRNKGAYAQLLKKEAEVIAR